MLFKEMYNECENFINNYGMGSVLVRCDYGGSYFIVKKDSKGEVGLYFAPSNFHPTMDEIKGLLENGTKEWKTANNPKDFLGLVEEDFDIVLIYPEDDIDSFINSLYWRINRACVTDYLNDVRESVEKQKEKWLNTYACCLELEAQGHPIYFKRYGRSIAEEMAKL